MGSKAIAKATTETTPKTAMFEAPLPFPLEGLAAGIDNPCGAEPDHYFQFNFRNCLVKYSKLISGDRF